MSTPRSPPGKAPLRNNARLFLRYRFGADCRGVRSNRQATRHPSCDLQQVRFHVHDLVVAVPFAREEVFQAVGLEPDGAVDEAVLVGAGVVPERVGVPKAAMRRVLKRAAVVGTGSLPEQPAQRGQTAVDLAHRVDRIAEVFEGVVRPNHTHLAVAKRPAPVEFDGNLSIVEIGQPQPGVAVRPSTLRFHRPTQRKVGLDASIWRPLD